MSSHDPFAPPAPTFPGARLARAGVADEQVEHLRAYFDAKDPAGQRKYDLLIRSVDDDMIRNRYMIPAADQLDGLTVPQLSDLASAYGQPVSGTKDELVARLTPLATEPQQPSTPKQPVGDPTEPVTGDQPDTPMTADALVGVPTGADIESARADELAVVEDADGVQHTGELPLSSAVDGTGPDSPVEPSEAVSGDTGADNGSTPAKATTSKRAGKAS